MTAAPSDLLLRAQQLTAERLGPSKFRVSGGSRPHDVTPDAPMGQRCDCPDHLARKRDCKHVIAANLAIAREPSQARPPAARSDNRREYQWLTPADLQTLPTPEELIRGHIPAGGLLLMYGPRGIGKSFLAKDLALTIATGAAWHGFHVVPGPVAYVLAEGRGGLARRIAAWQSHHGAPNVEALFLCEAIRLLELADVEQLVADFIEWERPPVLLVLDTLSRCLVPGDENSSQDMSRAVAAMDRIRDAIGCAVLVVHHTGHDKTRERGSTVLSAAADTVIAVAREADVLTLRCEKQRDSLEFPPLQFRLHPVEESVVPQRVMGGTGNSLSDMERQALTALEEACLDKESLPLSTWQRLAAMPDRTFFRARKRLMELAVIEQEGKGRQIRYRPQLTENERA